MSAVEGRGSAGHATMVAIVVAVALLAMAPGALAATHVVGGTSQWTYPPSTDLTLYEDWAKSITFVVGDTLEFKYTGGHDVVQLATKTEYDACGGTQVAKWTSGDDLVALNATGTFYYICSFPGHCTLGMKAAVTVTTTQTPPTPVSPTSPSPGAATSSPLVSIAGLVAANIIASLAFLA